MSKTAIIVNQKAKNAQMVREYLEIFQQKKLSYDLYTTEPLKLDETIKHCLNKYSLLLVGGGDGTVRSAAQLCAHKKNILGVLPLGTMNHFAKELALPLSAEEIFQAIEENTTITIDLGEVNGWYFVNNSSIGFYPGFAKKRDYYSKFYNKWLSYLPSLIQTFKKHKTFSIDIKTSSFKKKLSTSFLMISNNLYSFDFPFTITRESFTKGVLGIYFLRNGKMRLATLFKAIFTSKQDFRMKKSKKPVILHIDNCNDLSISLDGEILKVKTPLRYQSHPKALTLIHKSP